MSRIAWHPWTDEHIQTLYALLDRGASAARASVVLKRPTLAVQNKARQLGRPFPDLRKVRAADLAREARERNTGSRTSGAPLAPSKRSGGSKP
jgi:hypothetical protein